MDRSDKVEFVVGRDCAGQPIVETHWLVKQNKKTGKKK
jgi:hypothetical protein